MNCPAPAKTSTYSARCDINLYRTGYENKVHRHGTPKSSACDKNNRKDNQKDRNNGDHVTKLVFAAPVGVI
ncbi:hypothetical protein [Anaerocolumna xylanovorans]|uniref:hypothetical protein n=1 Tax=Anaerocolumna xylanovorans TaxID=100134 RepID=UPI0011148B95|nr:hypothetical protein [Anaerocolumna xylanovorans]